MSNNYCNITYLIVMLSVSFLSIVKLLTLPRYYELSNNNHKKLKKITSFVICRIVQVKIQVNSRGYDFDRLATVFIDQEQFKKNFEKQG